MRPKFHSQVREIPWRRAWQPTLVFMPEESHVQRSLVSFSPWGCKNSDRTEQLTHLIEPCAERMRWCGVWVPCFLHNRCLTSGWAVASPPGDWPEPTSWSTQKAKTRELTLGVFIWRSSIFHVPKATDTSVLSSNISEMRLPLEDLWMAEWHEFRNNVQKSWYNPEPLYNGI